MTIEEYEVAIMNRVHIELRVMTDRDEINKLYRQVRIWNRWHHFKAGACTYDRYRELNNYFKAERRARFNELEKGVIE